MSQFSTIFRNFVDLFRPARGGRHLARYINSNEARLRPTDLEAWYASCRDLLIEIAPAALRDLEQSEGWYYSDRFATPALRVCVIGQAGVGKSTLLNSLIAGDLSVLPAGGIGPFTASMIVARYSRRRYVRVIYRDLAILENTRAKLRDAPDSHVIAQARLLLCGSQFANVDRDRLLALFEESSRASDSDFPRSEVERTCIHRLREARSLLASGTRSAEWSAGANQGQALAELEIHAAGSLAPMAESIEIGWDATVLQPGLCLVDLPGLGIANDAHKLVTEAELGRARGALWVVDRAGLTESVLSKLKRADLLDRFWQDRGGSVGLSVVVTKMDLVALDERRRIGRDKQSFEDTLQDVRDRSRDMIASQLREATARRGSGSVSQYRALERTAIFGVSPVDHQRILARDDEEPARVDEPGSTGMPALVAHLRRIADKYRDHASSKLDEFLQSQHKRNRWRRSRRRILAELQAELKILNENEVVSDEHG